MKARKNQDNRNHPTPDRTMQVHAPRNNRFSRRIKITSASVLLAMTIQLIAPVASYALTSGPNQPEATSFEPIDTTDMVNLQSGDFTYNLPLLEVPGPEGGYPLSLSYHAGIQPNQDASWVGLGWTLNPGAINRSVNGYPDDWINPKNTNHIFWEGGVTKTYSVDVSIPITGSSGINFGLSIAHDTYLGMGVGYSVGYYFGTGLKIGPSASVGVGVSPFGGGYMSGGVGTGVPIGDHLAAGLGLSASTNFSSVSAGVGAGVSYSASSNKSSTTKNADGTTTTNPPSFGQANSSSSVLGASLSSSGGFSASAGGISANVSATTAAKIQTKKSGWSVGVFSYNKVRYWIDEKTDVYTHGSLNSSGWLLSDDRAYDTYALQEDPTEKNIVDYADPTKVQGGAFMDFDVYNVTAQGLGGNMRPYLFQGEALGQNKKSEDKKTSYLTYFSPKGTDSKPGFRFEDDFSNKYTQAYPGYSNPALNLRLITPPFDANPIYGNNDGNYGYNGANKLDGSKHVEVGVQIKPNNIKGYTRAARINAGNSDMIDGFSITNESGVTYHYGLPAYSYNEQVYQEKKDKAGKIYNNRQTKGTPYAYTWYLTSITGPDFVDRPSDGSSSGNGKAGPEDWGYWVNFDYGKWSDDYIWRTPAEGYNFDEDNIFKNCSMGHREVYYLNSVSTRTHVALFEKSPRMDGKGETSDIFTPNGKYQYTNDGIANQNHYGNTSAQSLRLDKIYLLNANDASLVQPEQGGPTSSRAQDLYANVIDRSDFTDPIRTQIENRAIRVIDMNYDYSLSPKTSNSFLLDMSTNKQGKLTLLNVVTRGKGGANLLPPTTFSYGLDNVTQANVTFVSGGFTTTNGNFQEGDMIESSDGITYYGVIVKKSLQGSAYNYVLANGVFNNSTNTSVRTTKNPPYNRDAFDIWGMFKSDFATNYTKNENYYRRVTDVSSKGQDAWSLRKIETATGAYTTIDYESDETLSSAMGDKDASLPIENIQMKNNAANNGGIYSKISFNLNYEQPPTSEPLIEGSKGKVLLENKHMISGATLNDRYVTDYRYNEGGNTYYIKPVWCNYTITKVAGNNYEADISGFNENVPLAADPPDQFVWNFKYQSSPHANLFFNRDPNKNQPFVGGGIRVAKLTTYDLSGSQSRALYNYNNPATGLSSGTTSYYPNKLESYINDPVPYNIYKSMLYANVNSLYALARELPPPGVMYEYVTVRTEVQNVGESSFHGVEGSTMYQFEVFKPNMVYRNMDYTGRTETTVSDVKMKSRNISISKFTASIGATKRVVTLDIYGRKITETINHYLHDGLEDASGRDYFNQYAERLKKYNQQGLVEERMSEVKQVANQETKYKADEGVLATMTAKEQYPSIQTGQTVINYLNGTKTESETIGFDFYSGAVTKSAQTDAYGNRVITETTPAYRKYGVMGLKGASSSNKHMLSQTAQTKVYKADANNNPIGYISSSVTTWSDLIPSIDNNGTSYVQNNIYTNVGDIWRPQYTYDLLPAGKTGDGLIPTASYVDFNWSNPTSSDANWKKTSEATLYDVYSKALESKDLNGNYGTTHMTYNSLKVLLSGSMSKYYEQAFSGAEDNALNQSANGFVKKGDGVVNTTASHTGSQSLLLSSASQKAFTYTVNTNQLTSGRDYIASVWVKSQSATPSDTKLYYEVGGVQKGVSIPANSSTKKAGDWTLVQLKIKGTDISGSQTFTVGCLGGNVASFVDDFRFGPVTGSSTAYVYDPFSGELTYILDGNNMYTHFKYDAMGRLIATYTEKLGVGEYQTAEYQQHYAKNVYTPPVVPQTIYARLEYSNYQTIEREVIGESTVNSESADAYIKFYSNAACTVPAIAPSVTIFNYQVKSSYQINPDYYSITNINSQNAVFIGNYTLNYSREPNDHLSQDPGEYYTTTITLNSGQNYTVVQ